LKLSHRIFLVMTFTAAVSIAAMYVVMHVVSGWPAVAMAFGIVLPVVLWSARMIEVRMRQLHDDLGNALRATRDGDHSLRLAVRGDKEIAELKRLYNELADAVRVDRQAIHNKEVLLDTILQRTPVAVVLLNAAQRIIYSNVAARELLAAGARLDGHNLPDLVEKLAPTFGDALASSSDSIFAVEDETFHLTQRIFRLNTQQHRLILLERLTPELRRQEVTVWKKAIRIINHEINNTIAPVSSLFHSARRAQAMPEHRHRLDEIYELIEERLQFLRTFLESYAQFARLPEPRRERTTWAEVLDTVRPLYPFAIEGNAQLEANIDRAQMQQALINLVKNAHESGSAADEIVVSLQRVADDVVLRILDRGRGMPDEVMRQALVPFYTTKPHGSGLGLALCNEIIEAHGGRMRLAGREGGGTVVTCWVPAA
jgi:two-component system, NtrC family, nitrogen regulation sensor histidine kinase NtrY